MLPTRRRSGLRWRAEHRLRRPFHLHYDAVPRISRVRVSFIRIRIRLRRFLHLSGRANELLAGGSS